MIRVGSEGICIDQKNAREIVLAPGNIMRITRDPESRFIILHTNLSIPRLKIYTPLAYQEDFEALLGTFRPIEIQKEGFLSTSKLKTVFVIAAALAYIPAFYSDDFQTVLASFLFLLSYLGFCIYDATIKLRLLKGYAVFSTVLLLVITLVLCAMVGLRLASF